MSVINTSTNDTSYVPIMIGCVFDYLPEWLSHLKDCTFITKLRVVCEEKVGTDPIESIDFTHPPTDHPCGPIPTTGCFILTLIGKWNDIKKWNYYALQYKVSHIHDNHKNDKATFDALQEMGRHINACFTHPIAQEMINTTNGYFSGSYTHTIAFGFVINVDNNTTATKNNSARITYVDPSNPSKQHTASNAYTPSVNTPSIGWLCLFVIYKDEYWYNLPIVDLSSHTQFMKTHNPNDLPPAEATTYNVLIDKWNNEKCEKKLSFWMPKQGQLNPYTYLEAWNHSIKLFLDVQQKQKEQQEEEERNAKETKEQQAQEYFDEYKRLSLQQQTLAITSYIQQQQQGMEQYDDNNNTSDISAIDPLLITTLSSTLYNEYYTKYLTSQLNDLKIINHLQSHQYQQLSDAKLRYPLHHGYIHRNPRKHIALPFPSSSSPTSTSQIDTLIDLATVIIPTQPIYVEGNNDTCTQDQQHQQTSTVNNAITTNQHSPENQQYHNQHKQQQNLAILHHQYNVLDEQKHVLTIQYDELSTLLQSTIDNKDDEIQTLKQQFTIQISQMEKEMIILNNKIITLQQQITTSHDELITTKEQYEDELIATKQEHENEIITLKEECHRKELNAVKEAMASALTNAGKDVSTIPPHINNQISFLQQQLQSKDQQIKDIIQSKDQQITSLQKHHNQQLQEVIQSKDQQHQKQLDAKDQQIALLMQMLAEANKE